MQDVIDSNENEVSDGKKIFVDRFHFIKVEINGNGIFVGLPTNAGIAHAALLGSQTSTSMFQLLWINQLRSKRFVTPDRHLNEKFIIFWK